MRILILQEIKIFKKKSSLLLGHGLYFLGSKQQVFKAEPEPGENKLHSAVFGPGTQPELELEQPKLLTCGPTEATLMRINWFFLCTRLRVIGSLDMLTFSFTYHLT